MIGPCGYDSYPFCEPRPENSYPVQQTGFSTIVPVVAVQTGDELDQCARKKSVPPDTLGRVPIGAAAILKGNIFLQMRILARIFSPLRNS